MKYANDLTVKALKEDRELRRIHLRNAVNNLFSGDEVDGRLMLRDIINATCGFQVIANSLKSSDKSVMQMLGENSNPTQSNLFGIIKFLIEQEKFVASTEIKDAV